MVAGYNVSMNGKPWPYVAVYYGRIIIQMPPATPATTFVVMSRKAAKIKDWEQIKCKRRRRK